MLARFAGNWWRRLGLREDGQDLLEYALLVALIALVAVGAVTTVGTTIKTVFWDVISAATAAL
jgi:pilus assembly protein Flp/PilA